MVVNFLRYLVLAFFIVACASYSAKETKELRDGFATKDWDSVSSFLKEDSWAKDPDNLLLKKMYQAHALLMQKNYDQAFAAFQECHDLIDQYYTQKITDKAQTFLLNENLSRYEGHFHEKSFLYFYQALAGLYRYQNAPANEKNNKLNQLRAILLSWDSFYKDLRRTSSLRSIFHGDLIAKVMAANIHELLGRKDYQISLILYQDALNMLKTQGLLFPSFNQNYLAYERAFFEEASKSEINKLETQTTPLYKRLENYLHYKILSIVQRYRKYQYKKIAKELSPSKEILLKLKRAKDQKLAKVGLLFTRGMIEGMEAEHIEYSLNSAMENIEDKSARSFIQNVGIPVLTYFALGQLGLGYISSSPGQYVYVRHNIGEQLVQHVGIEFELPKVKLGAPARPIDVLVRNLKTQEEFNIPLAFISSSSEIFWHANNESKHKLYTVKGMRIATKYILAIIAAYSTYHGMSSNKDTSPFAQFAAIGQFFVTTKAINASEQADTRFWATIFDDLFLQDLYLPEGDYEVIALTKQEQKSQEVVIKKQRLGTFSVQASERKIIPFIQY